MFYNYIGVFFNWFMLNSRILNHYLDHLNQHFIKNTLYDFLYTSLILIVNVSESFG